MTEFKLPELGENIDQGDLVRLMISPGTKVTEGQAVMELETEKAVVEVPSSVSGTVREVRVKEGEKVRVGQVIFTIDNGAGGAARAPAKQAVARAQSSEAPHKVEPSQPVQAESKPMSPQSSAGPTEFKLPELGENISEGDLVRLMISLGSKVSEGQPVMELETEKAVVEVPSSVTGVVKEIRVKRGEKVQVGQVFSLWKELAHHQAQLRSTRLWSMFPASTARALPFRRPLGLKAKPRNRPSRPISLTLPCRLSSCRHSWAKSPAHLMVNQCPQLRTYVGLSKHYVEDSPRLLYCTIGRIWFRTL
jgi:pyruvate/2-oxoglutarate dehydrogenase complex dihydrolipoamide acyltransferase (E2) component